MEKKGPPLSKYNKETAKDDKNPQLYNREPLHSHKNELPTSPSKMNSESKPWRDSNHNHPERHLNVNGWRHREEEEHDDHYEEEARPKEPPKPKPQSVRKKPAKPPQTDEAAADNHSPMAAATADIFEDEEGDKLPLHHSSKSCGQGKVAAPSHGRTSSLPAGAPPKTVKMPARAASFRPDDAGTEHVHPQLPDYDGLAARIALLSGGKL